MKENNQNIFEIIDKNTLNLLIKRKGILLEDVDLEKICDTYDKKKVD